MEITRHCDNCGHETTHEVSIETVEPSEDDEYSKFGRHPHHRRECTECGKVSRDRPTRTGGREAGS